MQSWNYKNTDQKVCLVGSPEADKRRNTQIHMPINTTSKFWQALCGLACVRAPQRGTKRARLPQQTQSNCAPVLWNTHKSSKIAVKSKAISFLLANYTQRALGHAYMRAYTPTTDKHRQIQCETIKRGKMLEEMNNILTVHPLQTWIKCVSWGSIKSQNERFLA